MQVVEVSATLIERFRQHAGDPEHREAVIVTLGPNGHLDDLVEKGLAVSMSARGGTIVAGTVDAAQCDAVAAVPSVIRIEPDGEMNALAG